MHAFTLLALVGAAVATPMAAGVTSAIAPSSSAPAGCSSTYSGTFEISVLNVSSTSTKRSTALTCTLKDGVLTDAEGRTGYIASNDQFQFDDPPQDGAIYTAGWSVCSNGTLALGDDAIFYECLSGTFYNLYDESTGAQCSEVYIDVIAVSSSTSASATGVTASSDGQVTAASATSAAVSQISDGQVQATTATAVVVSQISDGQIQATTATAAVVSQISDGQIQATTGKASSTTSAAVVTQISDGQIQATTGKASSTGTAVVVSQISDGQIQASATNGTAPTSASATISAYTGAAALPTVRAEFFGLAAGMLALAAL